ncbi:TerB family tellurite resistance protein [Aestuariivita boseongensis]|uniref:tellurite resistance TerB family protein n=1 Tax=Aestuariivita boseongensis TaxID=1470562 RepID=UPI0006826BAE|nr:TerB family tellurite resistance protein [Aestuariivita boseongensis]
MLSDILKRLTAPTPETLPDDDARLALSALLVRIARSDGHYDAMEKAQIQSVISARYELSEVNAQALLQEAEKLEAEAPDTVRFTRAIKDAVPYEDRLGVVEALWSVALADGARDDEEDAILRLSSKLLGVNDRDSALARQRAQAG